MNDFDDAVGDMADNLLAEAGGSFTYLRGRTATTVTLRKSVMPSLQIDTGNGHVIEVRPVDFIGVTASLPYATPEPGDRISALGETFELQPTVSEKVFRRISPQMTRLHTKQVK